ncbi:MAG: hypothetical protein ACO3NZ_13730, partial [Pirellulales bacterium]
SALARAHQLLGCGCQLLASNQGQPAGSDVADRRPKPKDVTGSGGMAGAMEHQFGAAQTRDLSRDLQPMSTPAPEWMPAQCRLTYPS